MSWILCEGHSQNLQELYSRFSVTSLRCPGESLMKVCGGHTVSAQTCATDEGGSAAMCLTSGVCAMGRIFYRWWIPLSIDQQFGNYCNIIHDVIINAIIYTFRADIPYPVLPLSSDCIISLLLENTIIESFFLSVWRVLQPNGSMQIHYAAKSNYIIITSHVLFQLQIALRKMWKYRYMLDAYKHKDRAYSLFTCGGLSITFL